MKTKEAADVSIKEDADVTEVDPIANLLDPYLIGSAIMQCLIENDPEGVMEIIEDHLYALNKSKFLREANVPRSTMYQLLKRKNPTIKTLAKIMYATHH
jgi:DNA-binding phage protein